MIVRGSVVAMATLVVLVPVSGLGTSIVPGPNLVPLPPQSVTIAQSDPGSSALGLAIRFSTTTFNRGQYDLDLIGLPPDGTDRTAASQCVLFAAPHVCREREVVGEFGWHPQHGHWHFEGYATYQLRQVLPDGTPDLTDGGLVSDGGKVSFCLADTERPDGPADPADQLGTYSAVCPGIRQGISARWGDTYGWGLYGQQVPLDGVADGTYAIVIDVNPDRILFETNEDDNMSWTIIQLTNDLSDLKVVATGP